MVILVSKTCCQQGNTTKAIEHYEKFLDLWKDADSGIPGMSTLIEDAKKRLAGLIQMPQVKLTYDVDYISEAIHPVDFLLIKEYIIK